MNPVIPIQAENAVVHVAALPGMQVVHAPADENCDALALRGLLQAVELGCEQAANEPLKRFIGDYGGSSVFHLRRPQLRPARRGEDDGEETVSDLKLTFSNIENHVDGEYAWTVCDVEAEVWFPDGGEPIRRRGCETFVFHRERDYWKAVYAHGSPRGANGR